MPSTFARPRSARHCAGVDRQRIDRAFDDEHALRLVEPAKVRGPAVPVGAELDLAKRKRDAISPALLQEREPRGFHPLHDRRG